MNKSASSFMEYTIILGVVSAVLIGMNTYVKRGVQARLKEMTDYFISNEQVVEVNPTATTTSSTNRLTNSTANGQTFIGGGTSNQVLETISINATSTSEDRNALPPPD